MGVGNSCDPSLGVPIPPKMSDTHYVFVVDTTEYSGNFERLMCAYVTGEVGECLVGEEVAGRLEKDGHWSKSPLREYRAWIDSHVEHRPDEHGCHRPCAIGPTPGFFNDGMGNHWPNDKAGSPEVLLHKIRSVTEYFLKNNPDRLDEEVRRATAEGAVRHPAYQSVEMYFAENPPLWVRRILQARAEYFCLNVEEFDKWLKPITLLGVRVLKREVVETLV